MTNATCTQHEWIAYSADQKQCELCGMKEPWADEAERETYVDACFDWISEQAGLDLGNNKAWMACEQDTAERLDDNRERDMSKADSRPWPCTNCGVLTDSAVYDAILEGAPRFVGCVDLCMECALERTNAAEYAAKLTA